MTRALIVALEGVLFLFFKIGRFKSLVKNNFRPSLTFIKRNVEVGGYYIRHGDIF